MPPQKPDRSVRYERHLAKRIRTERERLDLTLDRLAQKMTEAGCPMDRSAIYRIESGDPPRRITVDEAVTFAHVFGLPLSAMILPAAIARSREATKLYKRYTAVSEQYVACAKELDQLRDAILAIADDGYEAEVLSALESQDGLSPLWSPADHMQAWRSLQDFDRKFEKSRGDS